MDEALVVYGTKLTGSTPMFGPYAMEQEETDDIIFAKIQIEARMMKCPFSLHKERKLWAK